MKFIKELGMMYPPSGNTSRRYRYSLYECPVCKSETIARPIQVANKLKKTCSKECGRTTHGMINTKLYRAWVNMRSRCDGAQRLYAKYYKDKGVTVCDEWSSFEPFMEWSLSNGYEEGLTLDKDIICHRDNIHPKIYSPTTCLWVTQAENNKQKNKEKQCQSRVYCKK